MEILLPLLGLVVLASAPVIAGIALRRRASFDLRACLVVALIALGLPGVDIAANRFSVDNSHGRLFLMYVVALLYSLCVCYVIYRMAAEPNDGASP